MSDVLRALGISAGLLSLVVVLIVIISIVTVKRGEASNAEPDHDRPDDSPALKETAAAPPVKAGKPAVPAADEISVPQILIIGTGVFVLTVVALLAVSLIQHMN